jgi:hypothetical protein
VERRRFTRIGTHLRAVLNIGHTVYPIGKLLDIGIGGCRFAAPEPIADGTACRLRLLLDPQGDEPAISLDGQVRQRGQGEVAVEFTAVTPANLHHLQQLIRYNAADVDAIENEIATHPGLR